MKHVFLFLIRFYRKFISPLTPPTCRFYPTCSHYGMEAIGRFGAIKGVWLKRKRIRKGNPFHTGGIDHDPEKKEKN